MRAVLITLVPSLNVASGPLGCKVFSATGCGPPAVTLLDTGVSLR